MRTYVRLGLLLVAVLVIPWALAPTASHAQGGTINNCPQAGKWAISVWDGDDGTNVEQALNTCGAGAVTAAYHIDPETQVWSRWFADRPDISNLPTLDNLQGIWALGSAVGSASSNVGSMVFAAQASTMHKCPQPEKWAISVWDGPDDTDIGEALDTCGVGEVAAAYHLDPATQAWHRWIRDREDISNLLTIDNMQGLLLLRTTLEYPDFCSMMGAIPATYYGTVTIDGQPAREGTVIQAIGTDEVTWGTTTVTSEGSYAVDVPEPLPVSPPCFPGGTLSFKAGGLSCEESPPSSGPSELDLHCTSAVGGIAKLPEVSDSAGRNYVALAGLAAAALVALGAGGWYARRRFSRG